MAHECSSSTHASAFFIYPRPSMRRAPPQPLLYSACAYDVSSASIDSSLFPLACLAEFYPSVYIPKQTTEAASAPSTGKRSNIEGMPRNAFWRRTLHCTFRRRDRTVSRKLPLLCSLQRGICPYKNVMSSTLLLAQVCFRESHGCLPTKDCCRSLRTAAPLGHS